MFTIWLEKILLKLEIVTLTLTSRKYLIQGSLITNFFQNKFDCGMKIWAKEPSESLRRKFCNARENIAKLVSIIYNNNNNTFFKFL